LIAVLELIIFQFINKYRQHVLAVGSDYLYRLAGWNRLLRGLDKYILKGWLIHRFFSLKKITAIRNYIECESHRESLLEYINTKMIISSKGETDEHESKFK